MVRKDLVKKYFSRFSKTYYREAYIQRRTAKDLIDFGKELIHGIGIDLGSGTGYIADFLKDKNISVINIDLSRDMLKAVEFGINIQGDIENLPFKDNSFNFVISSFSLHWTDLNKSFKEINRILDKNGNFLLAIPIEDSLKFINFLLNENKFNFLSEYEVINTLKENGLSIKDYKIVEYYQSFKNGYDFLKHLHQTGVSINTSDKSFREKKYIVNKFKNWKNNCFINYRLIFLKGSKA